MLLLLLLLLLLLPKALNPKPHIGIIGTISTLNPKPYMGGCQNYGPFLGALNIRGRSIIGIQKRGHNFDNHPYIRNPRSNPINPL